MQQRGWTYEPTIQKSSTPEPRTVGELGQFRSANGYGAFTTSDQSGAATGAADRNGDYYSALSAENQQAYRQDLNGDISGEGEAPLTGSCEAVAKDAIGIPLEDQAVMVELGLLYDAETRSPEYLEAMDAWRRCLSDRGFEFSQEGHPSDLVFQRAADVQGTDLAEFEIEVAVADFECALTTRMPVLHRLETEIVRKLVEKYPEWGS
jgi:hypothetical protein